MSKIINLVDSDDDLDMSVPPQKRPKTEVILDNVVPDQTQKRIRTKINKEVKDAPFKNPLEQLNVATTKSTPALLTTTNKSQSKIYSPSLLTTTPSSTSASPLVETSSWSSAPSTITSTESTKSPPSSTTTVKSGRHRSRKTQHRTICHSPDIQFETIDLAKEEEAATQLTAVNEPSSTGALSADYGQCSSQSASVAVSAANSSSTSTSAAVASEQPLAKATKGGSKRKDNTVSKTVKTRVITPKGEILLNSGASQEEIDKLIYREIDRFLARTEIEYAIQDIADNQVRTNYLLTLYGMQEMALLTGTHLEVYKIQFNDRLKARESRLLNEELQKSVWKKQLRQLEEEKEEQEKRMREQEKLL